MKRVAPSKQLEQELVAGVITSADPLGEAALRGVPLQVVQRLLGHSSITLTQRYAHSTDDAERAAVQILGKVGNKSANDVEADSRQESASG